MTSTVKGDAKALRTHPPAKAEAGRAQAAAVPPSNDAASQAKAAQVDEMSTAKPGTFDKAAFVAAVRAAIAKAAPANAKEAEEFASSGKADQVKGAVKGQVGEGKAGAERDIKGKAEQPPDPSRATPKAVTPLAPEKAPARPGDPGSAAAMPKPAPPEQTDLSQPKAEVDGQMAEAGVSEQTLANSNESQFTDALAAKKEGEAHSATAPATVKANEAKVLADVKAGASADAKGALAAMVGARASANAGVGGQKSTTKSADEAARADVANQLEGIYNTAKLDTETILKNLDGKVDSAFETGEKDAKDAFEEYHSTRVRRWKIDRYLLAFGGTVEWIADQFKPLHPDLVKIFADARALYIAKMDAVISKVADLVGTELGRARQRIVEGRTQAKALIEKKRTVLGKYAAEAEASIDSKFDDLDKSVDDKQDALVDTLATKYVEARTAIDERITALQDENKGLWEKAKDAVKGVIETIKKLKDMLMGLLARAANAVEAIIEDPIGFVGKLFAGIKAGLNQFMGRIGSHLKKGLQGWLFGQLADAGIELPEKFDLKGIFTLVASIIGLSWANFRNRLVKQVGEPAAAKIEQGLDFVKAIASGGIAAAWQFIADKLSGIKDMVMDQIRNFVIERIVMAGITWLIGLLNPAAAFIKACKMIYDVVMWFVANAARIKSFVEAVLDSVEAVVSGGIGKVASMIEDSLAKVLPLAIGFLASLLGLGGLSDKIRKILDTVQKPVNKAFDFLIGKAAKWGKSLMAKLKNTKLAKAAKRAKEKAKEAYAKGKAYVKGKVEAGKQWVKGKVEAGKRWVKGKLGMDGKDGKQDDGGKPVDPEKAARDAAKAGYAALKKGVSPAQAPAALSAVLDRNRARGVKSLELVEGGGGLQVKAQVNPTHIWVNGVRVTISPLKIREIVAGEENQGGRLSANAAAPQGRDDAVSARGFFLYDGRGHELEELVSADTRKYRQYATRSAVGSHAEETLVNAYAEIYADLVRRQGKKPYDIKFGIDVSKSSCPNCASHIVRFIRQMEADGCKVSATTRFATLYHGRSGSSVTVANMPDTGTLLRLFYDEAQIKPASTGRIWGGSAFPAMTSPGFSEVPAGEDLGKAGLAILRSGGVAVEILGVDDLGGPTTAEQRQKIRDRNEKLQNALTEVDKALQEKGKGVKATA